MSAPWPRKGVYRVDEGPVWFVPSVSLPGTYRKVEYHCDGTHIFFVCDCPAGRQRVQMGSHFENGCRHVLLVSAAEADDGIPARPAAPVHVSALVD